jgi:hypothetical protein
MWVIAGHKLLLQSMLTPWIMTKSKTEHDASVISGGIVRKFWCLKLEFKVVSSQTWSISLMSVNLMGLCLEFCNLGSHRSRYNSTWIFLLFLSVRAHVSVLYYIFKILSHVRATRHRVWIANWIYWSFITHNYKELWHHH